MSKTNDDIKNKVKNDKTLTFYNKTELSYVSKPVGKSIFNNDNDNAHLKKFFDPKEVVTCKLCKRTYTKANRSKHNKTQYHKIYESINNKLIDFIIK